MTNSPAGTRTHELDGDLAATDIADAASSIMINTTAFIFWIDSRKSFLGERFFGAELNFLNFALFIF